MPAVILLATLVYLPGASGPFVFDDYTNLVQNSYLQVSELTLESLRQAAYSLRAGPLQRPVAMLSFALNSYYAGGFGEATPFKWTNIALHGINGILVFLLLRLTLGRLASADKALKWLGPADSARVNWIAGALATLWVVHPIQLTSVLYVVQRMTSLAALFTLLALLCYLHGRLRSLDGNKRSGLALMAFGVTGFGILGMLSKENAILLPLFIAAMELTLFRTEAPWTRLSRRSRHLMLGIAAAGVITAVTALVIYSLPHYAHRDFTMLQRLLTESRVLFYYLSLMLVPRIDELGLYHDDFSVSLSLLTPWTTLPSTAGIIGLITLGIATRRRYPMLSLGILWFFAGHALESTIISLEIAHEHRNYLPSLGVWLALGHPILTARKPVRLKSLAALPVILVVCSLITLLRSAEWSNAEHLARFEVGHRPNSADAHNFLGVVLARQHRYDEATPEFRRAAELNKSETLYLVNAVVAGMEIGLVPTEEEQSEILRRIRDYAHTGSILLALENLSTCIQDTCAHMQPVILRWAQDLTDSPPPNADKSFLHFLLGVTLAGQGRFDEALVALKQSHAEDAKYLHPLIEITKIHLRRGNVAGAEQALETLTIANRTNLHRRDREITALSNWLQDLKSNRPL
jgi:tetratricopeptide (TPR) repeat protein